MPWPDRIREAAIVSPLGVRTVFDFEDVSKTLDKNGASFDFPDANGTYVQGLGHSGWRYPLRIFFWGDDYDQQADTFETAFLESGIFILEHPMYGVIDTVPLGTFTRRDDLKTAANQAVFEFVLFETIGLVYPSAQEDPGSAVLSAVSEYNDAAALEFSDITSLDTAVEKATLKGSFLAFLDRTKSGLQSVADVQEDVQTQFNAITDSINQGIDVLISDPLTLAFQTVLMIQAPARAAANIKARLSAYSDLASAIISGDGANVSPGLDSTNANEFHTRDLYASTYVSGSILSVVNTTFENKPDAIAAAEAILQQFEDIQAWRDTNFDSLEEIDEGVAYQQLQEAVAIAAGFLVEISFTLKQERRLVLESPRNFVELVAELYGETDDKFDFFITSNNLTGSEIIEIPRGREIVYYI